MKAILGIILTLIGIVVGLYVGIWVMFIGGVVNIAEFIAQDLEPMSLLAWGLLKIILAQFVGWISASFFIVNGWILIAKN